jgi:GT2 family glycosyltransferase
MRRIPNPKSAVPDSVPRVTVVIPNWNTRCWLTGCLDGLRNQNFRDFQTLLVDNGSTDDSVIFVQTHYPEVEVHHAIDRPGFAPTVNYGIRQARSEYIVLLNADTVPHPNWLGELVAAMDRSPATVGGLASKMLSMQDPSHIDNAGDLFSWYGSNHKRGFSELALYYQEVEEVFSVCAGAALYRRSFLEDTGGLDERFESYLEDIDLGLRGRLLGYRYLYVPTAQIVHQSHGSGLARTRYVYLMTRNRLAILTKNIPAALLLKHGWTLLYGQFYYFLVYKHPWQSLKGLFAFLIALPHLLQQRGTLLKRRCISNVALDAILTKELGEPNLREILKNKLHVGT